MKRTAILSAIILVAAAVLLPAQETGPQETGAAAGMDLETNDEGTLTLDAQTAVALALRSNLGIESEELSVEMKKRTKDMVWNRFVPKVSVGGTLSRMNEEQTMSGLAPIESTFNLATGGFDEVAPYEIEQSQWNISGRLNVSLDLTMQLFYGIKAAALDYRAGMLSLETARKKLERDVQKSFYELLVLQQNISYMEDQIENARDRYRQAQANYEAGLVDEYTMLSAQVALENLKPGLEEILNGYQAALMGFNQTLGLELTTDVELEGSIEPETFTFDGEKLIDSFLLDRLDIQSLRQTIKSLENSRDLTLGGLYPILSLSFSMDPTFTGDPFADPWFDNIGDDWMQPSGMFAVTITWPIGELLPFSQTQTEAKNKETRIKQTRVNLQQAVQGAEMEVRSLLMSLDKSRRSLETLELNVQLAQRAYDLAETAYNAGNKELLEVQNAELELQKAKNELLSEKANYLKGLLDLEYALNTSMEELEEISNES
ncbi:MAG: TolC family protein [Spirochaetales bacterium]|nr:TolC family protein [Spirochaetales bacterium]MCF7937977.1 TolC family protein [Spirochaetales bacterium]